MKTNKVIPTNVDVDMRIDDAPVQGSLFGEVSMSRHGRALVIDVASGLDHVTIHIPIADVADFVGAVLQTAIKRAPVAGMDRPVETPRSTNIQQL